MWRNRKVLVRKVLLPALFALLLAAPAGAGLLDEIKERQKGVRTVRAEFRQLKHTELLERPIKSKGTFYFKSPLGVRWEYEDAMVVIYDGKTLYLHYTELDEADKVDGVSGFVGPLVFDLKLLLKDYEVEASKVAEGTRLDLKPKKSMPFQSMVMIFPDGAGFPSEVSIFEETGDRTVIMFHEVKVNVAVSDELLKFSPPPGVVIRERTLQ
jgi:outer membrane lipoprotein-sorting protein